MQFKLDVRATNGIYIPMFGNKNAEMQIESSRSNYICLFFEITKRYVEYTLVLKVYKIWK